MAEDLYQYSISVSPTMEGALEKAKTEYYSNTTNNEMIKDLISRGLAVSKTKKEKSYKKKHA